jgi:outer membrane protein
MRRHSLASIVMVLAAQVAGANDLKELYDLALARDAALQAAGFQRDAAVEVRPQALAQWLPQLSVSAAATRERAGFDAGQSTGTQAADCALSAVAGVQHCYGTARGLGLTAAAA